MLNSQTWANFTHWTDSDWLNFKGHNLEDKAKLLSSLQLQNSDTTVEKKKLQNSRSISNSIVEEARPKKRLSFLLLRKNVSAGGVKLSEKCYFQNFRGSTH